MPLLTAPTQISTRLNAVLVALTVLGVVLFLFFGSRWRNNVRKRQSLFLRIKARQIGPMGEEGTEIPPTALAELPSEEGAEAESKP